MKKTFKILLLIVLTVTIVTGCKSKHLTSYIKEESSTSGNTIGYIEMNKKEFKELATKKEFTNLMNHVKEQEYEYFIVAFENNKGLYCLKDTCLYEDIEKDSKGNYIGTVNIYGQIKKDEDDVYQYNKY